MTPETIDIESGDELFADELFTDESTGPAPILCGRSEIQAFAECPLRGHAVHNGLCSTSSTPADIGNEIHRILAMAVKSRSENGTRPYDLRELIREEAARSRPDVQPFVVDRLWCIYKIVELICADDETGAARHEENLERYDGGDGTHSGQISAVAIAATEGRAAVHITCELDLLMRTASPEQLDVIDWKSGFTHWTATAVKTSFQFQFYAVVTFINYPRVNRISVRVFMTAKGEMTSIVIFERKDFYDIHKRIMSALDVYLDYRDEPQDVVPAWPAPEKCSTCPYLLKCRVAHEPTAEVARDPESTLYRLVVIEKEAATLRKILSNIVRERGADLVFPGAAFGCEKPAEKATKAKPCVVYDPPKIECEKEPALARREIATVIDACACVPAPDRDFAASEALDVEAKTIVDSPPRDLEAEMARRERGASIAGLSPWDEFKSAWLAFLGDSVSGSDFAAGMAMLVKSLDKKGRENSITRATRAKWVTASLDGKLNWLTGKVTA